MARKLTPEELDGCVRELPVAPTILAQLQQMLAADATNALDVIPLLRVDPALSASVLRLARSPLYQRATLPGTLDEAVVRLGFAELSRLVSYTVMRQIAEPVPAYGISAEFFWRKSVACALAMELLAERRDAPAGTPYLIGLLHAVGELLLQRVVGREADGRIVFDAAAPEGVARQEIEKLGLHQGDAAAHALRHWSFPEAIFTPIEKQFAPHDAGKHAAAAGHLVLAKWLSLTALGETDAAAGLVARGELSPAPNEKSAELVTALEVRLSALDAILAGIEVAA